MARAPDPAVSPQSDLWKSLDWLVDDPIQLPPAQHAISWAALSAWLKCRARRLRHVGWRRGHTFIAVTIVAAVGALGSMAWQNAGSAAPKPPVSRPAPPRIDAPFAPGSIRDLSRDAAIAWNASAEGVATLDPAAAFVLASPEPTDYQRSLDCMTQAIHFEAATEGVDGGRAVAQVVLNRVRHPAYPDTVCGVIYEGAKRTTGCQFSFACDGSLARTPSPRAWQRARAIAVSALAGNVYEPVGWSTHYHANYVVPYWASSLEKTATVGAHIFYRWTGRWGQSASFTRRYAGDEPLASSLLGAAVPSAASDELKAAGEADGAPGLSSERPILLGEMSNVGEVEGRSSSGKRDAAVREVDLSDREILIHPRAPTSPADSAAEQMTDRN